MPEQLDITPDLARSMSETSVHIHNDSVDHLNAALEDPDSTSQDLITAQQTIENWDRLHAETVSEHLPAFIQAAKEDAEKDGVNIDLGESQEHKITLARKIGFYACGGAVALLWKYGVSHGLTPNETIGGMVASGVTANLLLGKEHIKGVLGVSGHHTQFPHGYNN
jgi:hypothetical protein